MRRLFLGLVVLLVAGSQIVPARATPAAAAGVSGAQIVQTAMQYLGYAYTTVGNSPSTGFSCIGFVSYVYQVNGVPLPDDLWDAQAYAPAVSFTDPLPGDVLWFQNTVWPGLSHTGIYIGNGQFINAEWYNRGVVISSFTNDPIDGNYWMDHYLGASRPWGGPIVSSALPAISTPSVTDSGPPATTSTAPVAPATPPKPVLRQGPRARVVVTGLNVRARPSLEAPIKRLAGQGTKVVVLHQYGNWDWVQLMSGHFGWVYSGGIGVRGWKHSLTDRTIQLMQVRASGLRVHTRPGLAAPVRDTAYNGQRLLVLRQWNGWLRVVLPDGNRGWVSGLYVAPTPSQASLGDGAPVTRHAVRRHTGPKLIAGVRVHSRPGLHAPTLRLANRGTHVQILRQYRNWLRVRFRTGHKGWVFAAYVKR